MVSNEVIVNLWLMGAIKSQWWMYSRLMSKVLKVEGTINIISHVYGSTPGPGRNN